MVNQTTFRQLCNGQFLLNLVTKRISVSRRGIRKNIFENFHFRGHLPPKSEIENPSNRHLTQSRLQVTGCTADRYCLLHVVVQGQIRRYVEPDVIHSLVHGFVTSHLDYCNGLFAGCNAYTVRRLQWVQNTAARLVLGVPHSSPSQPLLRELHWLPIESRIKFKLCFNIPSFSWNCAVVLMRTVQAMY